MTKLREEEGGGAEYFDTEASYETGASTPEFDIYIYLRRYGEMFNHKDVANHTERASNYRKRAPFKCMF